MEQSKSKEQLISNNKKAYFNYQILETIECGIVLQGSEIKSLRNHGCNLKESYIIIKDHEAFIQQMEIPLYKYGTYSNHEPFRKRKLLAHKKQIKYIQTKIEKDALQCVPLKLYLKNGFAKISVGIARSKKLFDKRETIKKRLNDREAKRAVKYNR